MRPVTILLALLLPGIATARVISVDGPRILLSDLASGADPVDLGPAPAPGQRRRIHRRALATAGPHRLPRVIDVQTRSRQLTCSELQLLLSAALADGTHLAQGLTLQRVDCPAQLLLPVGDLALSLELPRTITRAGRVPVPLSLSAGQWPARRMVVTIQVDGVLSVVVAAEDIPAGAALNGARLRLEQRPARGLPSDAVIALTELQGTRTIVSLGTGEVIRRGSLAAVPLVNRGTPVTVSAVLQGLRVTSRGVARQDGTRGQTISVLSQASGRLIKATVVGPHQVRVEL